MKRVQTTCEKKRALCKEAQGGARKLGASGGASAWITCLGRRVPGAACLCTVTAAEGLAVSRGSGPGDLQLLLRLGAPGASD